MPLVERNGKFYDYRSFREGDRVRTKYLGSGVKALAWAAMLEESRYQRNDPGAIERQVRKEIAEEDRLDRLASRRRWREDLPGLEQLERLMDEVADQVDVITTAAMTAAGFDLHKRQWRRRGMSTRRGEKRGGAKAETPATPDKPAGETPATPETREQLEAETWALWMELVRRSASGDETILSKIPEFLDLLARIDPEGRLSKVLIRSSGADAAQVAERAWLARLAGVDLLRRGLARQHLEELRAELAGPETTPLERMLIERVVVCWLDAHEADVRAARVTADTPRCEAGYLERRRHKAHNRLMSAIKALQMIRQQALPALTVRLGSEGAGASGAGEPEPDGKRDDPHPKGGAGQQRTSRTG